MAIGTIILGVTALILIFGGAKAVVRTLWQRILCITLILGVILLNIIPPYVIGQSRFYIGSFILAIGALLVLLVGIRIRQMAINLISLAVVTSLTYFYKVSVVNSMDVAFFFQALILILMAALAAFIVGRKLKYAFSIAYLSTYIASLFGNYWGSGEVGQYVNVGGGSAFSISISAGLLSVAVGYLAMLISQKSDKSNFTQWQAELSEEIEPANLPKEKEKKPNKANKRAKKKSNRKGGE